MFFSNYAANKPLSACPGNDGHNVDTSDALVSALPLALFSVSDDDAAAEMAATVVRIRSFFSLLKTIVFPPMPNFFFDANDVFGCALNKRKSR